jgi:hypothetical protein
MFEIKKTKLNEPSTAGIGVCLVIFLVLVLMISRNAAGFLKVQWASECGTFVDLDSVIRLLVSLMSLLPSSLCQKVSKPGNGHSLAKHLLEMEIRRGFQAVRLPEGIQADTRKLFIAPKRFRVLKPPFPIASKEELCSSICWVNGLELNKNAEFLQEPNPCVIPLMFVL